MIFIAIELTSRAWQWPLSSLIAKLFLALIVRTVTVLCAARSMVGAEIVAWQRTFHTAAEDGQVAQACRMWWTASDGSPAAMAASAAMSRSLSRLCLASLHPGIHFEMRYIHRQAPLDQVLIFGSRLKERLMPNTSDDA